MPLVTLERLRAILDYNPDTGVFLWKQKPTPLTKKVKVGTVAGSFDRKGYRQITIDGRTYRAHRLAWFYVNGVWPTHTIDHWNGIRVDNRIDNLRDVPNAKNCKNKKILSAYNTSGFMGVLPSPSGRWYAAIKVDGKKHHLGTYDTPEEASAVYQQRQSEVAA